MLSVLLVQIVLQQICHLVHTILGCAGVKVEFQKQRVLLHGGRFGLQPVPRDGLHHIFEQDKIMLQILLVVIARVRHNRKRLDSIGVVCDIEIQTPRTTIECDRDHYGAHISIVLILDNARPT